MKLSMSMHGMSSDPAYKCPQNMGPFMGTFWPVFWLFCRVLGPMTKITLHQVLHMPEYLTLNCLIEMYREKSEKVYYQELSLDIYNVS